MPVDSELTGHVATAPRPPGVAEAPAPPSSEPHHDPHVVVIEARRGPRTLALDEIWAYRDLLYFLTRREIALRYKQTVLGVLWAVIQPISAMVIFTIFLGNLAKVPSDGIPYPVFTYLGLLPWLYFSGAVTRSAQSLVTNSTLLSKVYFPRVLIPLSATLSALADFVIAFVVLVVLMLIYGMTPAPSTVLLIPLVLLTALASLGAGMWLSAVNVKYRDVTHALPFLMQVWMYATPVVYPTSLVPDKWRLLVALNPLAGIIEAYRATTLGRPIDWPTLGVSTLATVFVLWMGLRRFARMEREFADIV